MTPLEHSIEHRVYYDDTDAGGVVYHSNYIRFMEHARTEWLRVKGWSHERITREVGILFVVRSVEVKFLRPARLDDLLLVRAVLTDVRRGLMNFKQQISCNGQVICSGEVRVISVDANEFRSVDVPPWFLQALGVTV
jgi:acyl-CoA thioester hydrolase